MINLDGARIAVISLGYIRLDNFTTGHQYNLEDVQICVTAEQWPWFFFVDDDICNLEDCQPALGDNIAYMLEQSALGSVPRLLEDPITTNKEDGCVNIFVASRDANAKSFTNVASSSTCGDHPGLPEVEDQIGKPLSPCAITKYLYELHAEVFARSYGFNSIGLRYFNVFGKRQDPDGAYAAATPKWIGAIPKGETVQISGDGETSCDFNYIANTVQANLLATTTDNAESKYKVYNIAVGGRTSLTRLFSMLQKH